MPAVSLNTLAVNISGDTGGTGISRFHFTNATGAILTTTEAAAAGSAIMGMYTGIATILFGAINVALQPTFQNVEVATGLVLAEGAVSPLPANVVGSDGRASAAGCGARGYWHTSTVSGRRIMRGYTYFTTFGSTAYAGDASLSSSTTGMVQAAMDSFLIACTAASIQPVVWHRPPAHTFAGGTTGDIIAASCSNKPLSVRSRRS